MALSSQPKTRQYDEQLVGPEVHGIPQEQVDHVLGLLRTQLAPYTKLQRINAYCIANNIAYRLESLTADKFCVHMSNRSELLLDVHNMHQKGHCIKTSGAMESKTSESVAFELSTQPAVRERTLVGNQKVVDNAGGLMAPVTRKEQYSSVGGSHFSQFVKATCAGCKTNVPELQDANGHLSVQVICKDDEYFLKLCNQGWSWLIYPARAELARPTLADFLQSAYNAGNAVYSPKGEMECMSDIALKRRHGTDLATVVEDIKKGMPACSPYLDKLAEFHDKHDRDGVIASRLHAFATRRGDNRKLGGEYIVAVVEAKFPGGAPCTHIRQALLGCNLVSKKVVDVFQDCL
jgi:hypothetical protein